LGTLVNFLRRPPVLPATPERCPCCLNASIPLEALGRDRFLCSVCSKDFSAVRDAAGDFVFDLRPLRLIHRQRVTRA
jgi:hypothetical protein